MYAANTARALAAGTGTAFAANPGVQTCADVMVDEAFPGVRRAEGSALVAATGVLVAVLAVDADEPLAGADFSAVECDAAVQPDIVIMSARARTVPRRFMAPPCHGQPPHVSTIGISITQAAVGAHPHDDEL